MALPTFTISELIEAGVHFGHKTQRWDPRMSPYLFGIRNKIHIIDLQQTVPLLQTALEVMRETAKKNGRILFVGTKYQSSMTIAEEAKRCGQYFVNHRWLGGMLTNWKTVSRSISTLKELEEKLADTDNLVGLKKKEILSLQRKRDKLDKFLGGIKEMGNLPDLMVVIDTNMEKIAVKEAQKLGVPIIAILDSNSNPEYISYPIPGNDDSIKAIQLYTRLMSDSILDGIQESLSASGIFVEEEKKNASVVKVEETKTKEIDIVAETSLEIKTSGIVEEVKTEKES